MMNFKFSILLPITFFGLFFQEAGALRQDSCLITQSVENSYETFIQQHVQNNILDLSHQNLGEGEEWALLEKSVCRISVEEIDLSNTGITELMFSGFLGGLVLNSHVKRLNLSDNVALSDGTGHLILSFLNSNLVIEEIQLEGTSVSERIICQIQEILDERN